MSDALERPPCAAGRAIRHPEWGDESWQCDKPGTELLITEDGFYDLCAEHMAFVQSRAEGTDWTDERG